ncbi:Uncharacterised protein [Corynebacterium minutissimum]|uniref:Uncharacterized protein n=2 Tax=Corynebacterium minutissimum TaxID=38301 RepID=A0A2X4RJ23_9CORY|nr:Uncharacterised protein [Corynebacterium minutissimum]VEG06617.1 Uncharacterised protein [Corynebacterium minutissimum]
MRLNQRSTNVDDMSHFRSAFIPAAILVAGLVILAVFYVGLSRHYNSQELQALIDGANANGQDYTVVLHNELTGSYSFNAE